MHPQICPPQSTYSPNTAQFWRPVDASSNRRVVLMAEVTVGSGTTMSSPGPTPPTPLSHRLSPAARSAPASPAPPQQPPLPLPPHPPARSSAAPTSQSGIMHFPHQPGGSASLASPHHPMVSVVDRNRLLTFPLYPLPILH